MDHEQTKRSELRKKIREELSQKSLSELSYILGRYCGPSNQFLSEKTFGYVMPADIVTDLLNQRALDDFITGDLLGSDE